MILYKVTIREKDSHFHSITTTYNLLAKDFKNVVALAERKIKIDYEKSEDADLFEVSEVEIIAFINAVEAKNMSGDYVDDAIAESKREAST